MSFSAKAIANYVIRLSEKSEHGIVTPLKLQKIVYIAHGFHLAIYDEPLVGNEIAEAWEYGPVFPSIYHEFKDFGAGPITRLATEEVYDRYEDSLTMMTPRIGTGHSETKKFIGLVWAGYGQYSAGELSNMTHEEGTPWSKTRLKDRFINAPISNTRIKNYYKDVVENGYQEKE